MVDKFYEIHIDHVRKQLCLLVEKRDKFVVAKLRQHLSLWDRFLFWLYKKLKARFDKKVVLIYRQGNMDKFGVKINGKEHWYEEMSNN